MSATAKELADEYRSRLCACGEDLTQQDCDRERLRYLERLYAETRDPTLLGVYMAKPREAGLTLIFRYIRGEITAAQLVSETKKQTSLEYIVALQAAGIIGELPRPKYDETVAELDLEMLKAYMPLAGADPALRSTCEAVAVAASTVWFRFVEQLHAMFGLPRVSELRNSVAKLSHLEDEVLDLDDFSAYAVTDPEDRSKLQAILNNGAMVGGNPCSPLSR